MKKLIFLVAFAAAFLNLAVSQRRIFNGQKAEKNGFPFLVSVRAASTTCGGVLLDELFVLTAAHCLMNVMKGQKISVVLGAHFYYSYKREVGKVKLEDEMKFWMHENFTMPSAQNDLAIIQLPAPVRFSDHIQPVKISTDAKIDEESSEKRHLAVLAGWGAMNKYFEPAEVLQTASLVLVPFKECIKFQSHFIEKLTEKHICAIGKNPVSASPCNGDSGSPLVLASSKKLVGITSFVKDAEDGKALRNNVCDSDTVPSVYVRVASYLDWITEKTGIPFD